MNIKSQRKKASQHGTSTHQASLTTVNGFGALRSVLEKACSKTGVRLDDLTVLSTRVDPYRLDTDAGHRDGRWIAEQLDRLVAPGKKIHWRGLHYLLVSTTGLREEAIAKLSEAKSAVARLKEQLDLATDGFDLPPIEVPQPEIDEDVERQALVSLDDNWVAATRALIARKRYGNGNGE